MPVDLRTRYLGLDLPSPLVASASPLTGDLDALKALEEAGAGAVVLPSLFEEQIEHDEMQIHHLHEASSGGFAEALSYFPELDGYNTGPGRYLEHLERARKALRIPVVASLNGYTSGGWVRYAQRMQDAGASALEINVFIVPTNLAESGAAVEARYVELVEAVRAAVSIPLAVKVAPYFSSPGHMATRLVDAGADGLVLFNRFLQPDVDLETLSIVPSLVLSRPEESRMPFLWIALLKGRVRASLAATSGAHRHEEALKLLLAGADVVMMASALLREGPKHLGVVLEGMRRWLDEREYGSVQQMKGSLSRDNAPDASVFERANYMRTLVSWRGGK